MGGDAAAVPAAPVWAVPQTTSAGHHSSILLPLPTSTRASGLNFHLTYTFIELNKTSLVLSLYSFSTNGNIDTLDIIAAIQQGWYVRNNQCTAVIKNHQHYTLFITMQNIIDEVQQQATADGAFGRGTSRYLD